MRSWPWRSLGLAFTAIAVFAAPGLSALAAGDREAILAGQVWRVWTGHLVHGSASHLVWNVSALVALGFLFERDLGRSFWKLIGASSMLIGVGTLVLQPGLTSYVGLSGVLNSIWVAGALLCARRARGAMRTVYGVAVLAGLGKIAVEGLAGISVFTEPASLGGTPVPLAHALGYLGGWIFVSSASGYSSAACAVSRFWARSTSSANASR